MANHKFPIVKQRLSQFFPMKGEETEEERTDDNLSMILKSEHQSTSSYKAFTYALISGFIYSVVFLIGKKTKGINAALSSIYFSTGVFLLSLPIIVHERCSFNIEKTIWISICLRGIFSGGASYLGFLAFRLLPLGDASVIVFSTPVFVTVLARIFFKERCARIDIVNLVLTLLGLALVSKIPGVILHPENRFSKDYFNGVLSAFGSLICFTGITLATRKAKSAHFSVVAAVSAIFSFIICCVVNAFTGKFVNLCGEEYLPLVLGLLGFLGRITFIRAVQLHNAGPISTFRSGIDILFAFFWQVLYFGDFPDVYVVSGAVLVMISIILIGLKICVLTLPEESVFRKKTAFLIK